MKNIVFRMYDGDVKGGSGGKVSDKYLRDFKEVSEYFGYQLNIIRSKQDLVSLKLGSNDVLVNCVNEDLLQRNQLLRDNAIFTENFCRVNSTRIIHNLVQSDTIGNKYRYNQFLDMIGVTVPALVSESTTDCVVFSNTVDQSHVPVRCINAGELLDSSRYNTEMVDTRVSFNGADYYVCLRAIAVGSGLVGILPRAKLVKGKVNASVHSKDTPIDPTFLNFLYDEVISRHRKTIEDFTKRIGDSLGLGFYVHDILIEKNNKCLVCESGYKTDDPTLQRHLSSIKDDLKCADELYEQSYSNSAKLFFEQL